jgi:hypothetical protein
MPLLIKESMLVHVQPKHPLAHATLAEGGAVSHAPSLAWSELFSRALRLLLDLTGLNWGRLEILEKI